MNKSPKVICGSKVFVLIFMIFGLVLIDDNRIYAAENQGISVTFPLEQAFFWQEKPAPDETKTFQYQIIALESPLPEGSVGGIYTIGLTGNQKTDTAEIVYQQAGNYSYRMEASPENITGGYPGGKEVYDITVYVKDTVSGLIADIIVKNDKGEKVSVLCFTYALDKVDSQPRPKEPGGNPSKPGVSFSNPAKTGDDTVVVIWFVFLMAAVTMLMFLVIQKRRK